MPDIEYRKHIRRDCRLACIVQFASGITVYGHSKTVGLDGLTVLLTTLPASGQKVINQGDTGLLTLRFRQEHEEKSLKVQCQVTNKMANGLGLSIRFYELNKQEQKTLGQLILSDSKQQSSLTRH